MQECTATDPLPLGHGPLLNETKPPAEGGMMVGGGGVDEGVLDAKGYNLHKRNDEWNK